MAAEKPNENLDELFLSTWDLIKKALLEDSSLAVGPRNVERLDKMLDYTCKGGKMTRGMTVAMLVSKHCASSRSRSRCPVAAVRELSRTLYNGLLPAISSSVHFIIRSLPSRVFRYSRSFLMQFCPAHRATCKMQCSGYEEELKLASRVVGWGIEILQSHFLVLDDIMDLSETRRGQPCWYKLPETGTALAINDGSLLRSYIFRALKHFIGHMPCYSTVVELFLEISYLTECGQMLDVLHVPINSSQKVDYTLFTMQHYISIVRHKTAYYTFYLPLALSLTLTGDFRTTVDEKDLIKISFLIGEYFQINDDILDCYGDPKTIGKIGTDIQDSKCSWLAVQFLSHATPQQRKEFQENYGKHEEACIQKIKKLYEDAKIKQLYDEYEADCTKRIENEISAFKTTCPVLHETLKVLWKVTCKRSK